MSIVLIGAFLTCTDKSGYAVPEAPLVKATLRVTIDLPSSINDVVFEQTSVKGRARKSASGIDHKTGHRIFEYDLNSPSLVTEDEYMKRAGVFVIPEGEIPVEYKARIFVDTAITDEKYGPTMLELPGYDTLMLIRKTDKDFVLPLRNISYPVVKDLK